MLRCLILVCDFFSFGFFPFWDWPTTWLDGKLISVAAGIGIYSVSFVLCYLNLQQQMHLNPNPQRPTLDFLLSRSTALLHFSRGQCAYYVHAAQIAYPNRPNGFVPWD